VVADGPFVDRRAIYLCSVSPRATEPQLRGECLSGRLKSVYYCLKTSAGPLTRFTWRATFTSTRSAIVTNGMPLFIP
jgi:hypothetical protein